MSSSTKTTKKPKAIKSTSGPRIMFQRRRAADGLLMSYSFVEVTPAQPHVQKAFEHLEYARTELEKAMGSVPESLPWRQKISERGRELEALLAAVGELEKPVTENTVNQNEGLRILEQAKKQSEQFKTELIDKGLVVSSEEICDALGFSRQALSKAVQANRMFFLERGSDQYYPVFYADQRLSRRVLEKITRALGNLSGAQKWQFFTRPKGSLAGKTPLQALEDGMVDKVLMAARGFLER